MTQGIQSWRRAIASIVLLATAVWTGAYGLPLPALYSGILALACHTRQVANQNGADCCGAQAAMVSCPMSAETSGCGAAASCCTTSSEPRVAATVTNSKKEPGCAAQALPVAAAAPIPSYSDRRLLDLLSASGYRRAVFALKADLRI